MGIEAYGQQRMQERRRGGRCVTWTMRAVLVLALFPGWLVGCSTAPPTTGTPQ
jgi:hypothetical protein